MRMDLLRGACWHLACADFLEEVLLTEHVREVTEENVRQLQDAQVSMTHVTDAKNMQTHRKCFAKANVRKSHISVTMSSSVS